MKLRYVGKRLGRLENDRKRKVRQKEGGGKESKRREGWLEKKRFGRVNVRYVGNRSGKFGKGS